MRFLRAAFRDLAMFVFALGIVFTFFTEMLFSAVFLVLAESKQLASLVLHFEEEIISEVRISYYFNFLISEALTPPAEAAL